MHATHAASTPEISATVLASAGTGKTYLLVTRLIRLLLAGAPPDAILAITFTRKAAGEMQTRLSERLYELANAGEALAVSLRDIGVEPTPETMRRAQSLYETLLRSERQVRVTTFHAFCQEILRRFPLEAGVPPGFEVAESAGLLSKAAWDALIAEATAAPDELLGQSLNTLYQHHGGHQGPRGALNSFLDHRSDWWAYTLGAADPVDAACVRLRDQLAIDPGADFIAPLWQVQTLVLLHEYAQLLQRHNTDTFRDNAQRVIVALDDQLNPEQRLLMLSAALLTQEGKPRVIKATKTLEKSLGVTGMTRLLELHAVLCEQVLAVHEQRRRLQTYILSRAWMQTGVRLLTHYQRIKTEQRVLDFADLEWKAYVLLNHADHAHWVQYKLDQRIDHLLIDEYQDTNPTQWRLILPLLEELAAGAPERARSVFLVGDSKQSIYRFRRADPRLLDAAADWLHEHLGAQTYSLDTSRRSAPAIMTCVNSVFAQDTHAPLLPGYTNHLTHHADRWGRVELLPLIQPAPTAEAATTTELRNPLHAPRIIEADARYVHEAQLIAERIQALVAAPTLVEHDGAACPASYGDIYILIRQRTHVRVYEKALRDAGIPYIGADRGTLLHCLEIQDLRALLNTLIAPYDNLALATVLRSPLFGASDADLMRLARHGIGVWMERLITIGTQEPADAPLGRAARYLPQWRDLAGRLPVHDLLDRIYSEGDVLRRYDVTFPAHLRPRVRANLTRFIELALAVDSGRYPSLRHFLARLGEIRELSDEAPAAHADNAVRIMTIHASKGLEAPIVFLADATATAPGGHANEALVSWPAHADRPTHFFLRGTRAELDELSRELIECEEQDIEREDLSLLYVALTRACQFLYISGCAPSRGQALGWYGRIAAGLAPADTAGAMQTGIVIETGSAPLHATDVMPHAVIHIQPDSRLSQPIPPGTRMAGVAPSRTVPVANDPDTRERGVAIHRFLELLNTQPALTEIAAQLKVAQELSLDSRNTVLREWYQAATLVMATPRLRRLFDPAQYEAAYDEVPIFYTQNGQRIYGIIDRVVLYRDECWVIDYKTHAEATAYNLPSLAMPYIEQLRLYRDGARKLWPARRVSAALLFTECCELHELPDFDG